MKEPIQKLEYAKPAFSVVDFAFDDVIAASGCEHIGCISDGCYHIGCFMNNQEMFLEGSDTTVSNFLKQ